MKIVFLSDDFPPESYGGAGISTFELAKGVLKLGHEVSVITTSRRKDEALESEYEGLKVYKIISNYPSKWRWYLSLYNPRTVKEVERILSEVKPEIVHINNVHFYLSYYCFKLAKRYAKGVVFTVRDVMTFNFAKLDTRRYLETFNARTSWLDHLRQARKRWNPLRNLIIKHYLSYAGEIVAISRALKKALEENGLKGADVIYNGLDWREWNTTEDEVLKFKSKYALTGKKILLFSGRLSLQKGGGKVVEALSLVVKKIPETVLVVLGNIDTYAEIMQQEARVLGVNNNLIFTGWAQRDEIKAAYKASNIVLMPSICFDAFGRVNIEAMAAKKPVIGTCYGGTPEIVIDGETGYIVNPLYPEQIAEKTIELLLDAEKAEKFGQRGFERLKSDFDLKDVVLKYAAKYDSLISKYERTQGLH